MPDYRFVTGEEYLTLPASEQTWVIEPLIPVGGLVNIYGQPKEAKKSWMGLNMALAVTNAWPVMLGRFHVRSTGPVVYLQVDTPRSLWRPRFELLREEHDLSQLYLADPDLVPYPMNLLDEDTDHTAILGAMVEGMGLSEPPLVVFIDTLREIHGGEENDSTVMRNVIAKLRTAFAGSAIVLISHSRKGAGDISAAKPAEESQNDNLMAENRGSSYVAGRMDTIIRLTPKYMTYQGRAVGRERLKIEWHQDSGLFSAVDDPVLQRAQALMRLRPEAGQRELARELASDMHLDSEEKARSVIRRLVADGGVKGKV